MAERPLHEAAEQLKEARRLQELFKGRFSEEDALELLKQQGSLSEAVDFVLNGDPAEVRKHINDQNEALVVHLQRDTDSVKRDLEEGLEARDRLFACQDCDHFWWRKVPARKEVSKCRRCLVKYDPVPRHEEWGLGEFVCVCGNTFLAAAWMNHTHSPCYKCGQLVDPRQIIPPSKRQERKNMSGRTGKNYYKRAQGQPSFPRVDKRVMSPSTVHVSTGSTVATFMSQGELAEDYQEILPMAQVLELEED